MPIDSCEGKVAFVTGGASGIGLGIARVLAGCGAQVVPADLRRDLLEVSGYKASEAKLSRRIVGDNWMEPEQAGELVAEGILANQTYIVTHGFYKDAIRARAEAVLAATPDTMEVAPDFGLFRDE